MSRERHSVEGSLRQGFQSLTVSRRLVRSMSGKLKKKAHKSEGNDEEIVKGFSLKCLTLYGRGGGCKVGAETCDDFGDPSSRRSSTSEEGKGYKPVCGAEERGGIDCFPYAKTERLWKRNHRRVLELNESRRDSRDSRMDNSLPDDILEMCLMRLPLTSLMNARLVCRKWNNLTTTARFMQMRREGLHQTPWLFLLGAVKDGICSEELRAFDVSLNQWHTISSQLLKGRFLFSVASIKDEIFVVGGCSSLTNFGRVDRSSYKTLRSTLVFTPSTKSWRKVPPMKYARSSPVVGVSELSIEWSGNHGQLARQDRRFPRPKFGGASDVYEDPHRLSVRRQIRNSADENDGLFQHPIRRQRKTSKQKNEKDPRRFVLIVVGGLGSWDEPLDSGEFYDSLSNKWVEIQKLPVDFGIVCSGVVCSGTFFVYSESDKLAGYDIEKGYWVAVHTAPSPPRVHEYYPKLVSSGGRLFMLSVSWCEGDGQIGRRNKAIRKMWELDLRVLSWSEVSTHPDAPMDWNAAFIADKNLVFGVEMFKIFGQILDFITVCDVSENMMNWSHISSNHVAHELDASSCMTKTMAVLHL